MSRRLALLTFMLVLLTSATAHASTAGAQRQGEILIGQLQAGQTTCRDLSAAGLADIADTVMVRALRSTALEQGMDARMRAMVGQRGESQLLQLLGARYVGCATRSGPVATGAGMMGESTMMGGYSTRGGVGAMMATGDWRWMTDGSWQDMTRRAWQRRERQLLGLGTRTETGPSAPALVGVCLGAAILATLAILAVITSTRRRPRIATPR